MKSAQRLRRITFVFVGLVLLLALVVMLSPSKPNAPQLNKSRLFPPSEAGPKEVEIVTQLDTLWQSPAKTQHRTTKVKCVTGPTNGQLVCRYEVLRMTNFHGHTFPLQFRLVQYPDTSSGLITWGAAAIVSGKVTSIKMGRQPRLPDDICKQLAR